MHEKAGSPATQLNRLHEAFKSQIPSWCLQALKTSSPTRTSENLNAQQNAATRSSGRVRNVISSLPLHSMTFRNADMRLTMCERSPVRLSQTQNRVS